MEEKKTPFAWAQFDYNMATNWGTGFDESFPKPEKMSLDDLFQQVKFFQKPFFPETYKEYDGWEQFDKSFEQRGFTTQDIWEYFLHYRSKIQGGVSAEYLAIYEDYLEDKE